MVMTCSWRGVARGAFNISGRTATAALGLFLVGASGANAGTVHPPGAVVVNSALGGQIFDYDVDQNGAEGIMSEAVSSGFDNTIAIETFDLGTGKVKIVKKIENVLGDFVTLGVVGSSIGLVDYQRERKLLHRLPDAFEVLNPLEGNHVTGHWTPSLKRLEFIEEVSESQGSSTAAVLAYKDVVNPPFQSFVFGTDLATNTIGPKIQLKNDYFSYINGPVIGLDTTTNQAIVVAGLLEGSQSTEIAVVDLTNATVSEFQGLGAGVANGIAIDSADGIACTATADDNLEFYNIANQTGTEETLQGANGDLQAGADVQFDAVNDLFLILQPDCSEGAGSCIEIYDTKGNWKKAVAGLTLAGGLVTREHIAFNPNRRIGFLQSAAGTLESFSY